MGKIPFYGYDSVSMGKIPSHWTKANFSPVFKKGNKNDPANYRPISFTCILCKVMEHIIASKLTQHLNQHNVYSMISSKVLEKGDHAKPNLFQDWTQRDCLRGGGGGGHLKPQA